MVMTDKEVLVIGTGISGIGAAKLLWNLGAKPSFFDTNKEVCLEELQKKLPENMQTRLYVETITSSELLRFALAVISPGVPVDIGIALTIKEAGIPLWGEMELAYRFAKGKVLAITGTNGKTTTTALLGQIMKDTYPSAFIVGNIGIPYTEVVEQTEEASVTVAEVSSFQLETIETFAPQVTAILNITPDHLNRHHTMENYVRTKEAIAKHQDKSQICVLNYEDVYTAAFGKHTTATPFYFSSKRELEDGIYSKDGEIILAKEGMKSHVMNISEMKLMGVHNVENVMAAIAMAHCFGVGMEQILETVRAFLAVEHRIEYVTTKRGVDYYNDSKATNPDAAIKGIEAMTKPTLLIGGGYDKDNQYDEWIEAFRERAKCLILLGQTREKIAHCAKEHGFMQVLFAENLEEVIAICEKEAKPGDAVLLSPACASWGMFPNYEVRGNRFKELVRDIKE